jgi:hypothetical protein
MNNSRIVYAQREGITPRVEIDALSAVYRIILSAKQRDRFSDKSGPDDPERRSDEVRAKTRIP